MKYGPGDSCGLLQLVSPSQVITDILQMGEHEAGSSGVPEELDLKWNCTLSRKGKGYKHMCVSCEGQYELV
jgi:hypothetical protein